MDNRQILEAGTLLPFPGMECTIDTLIGRGANAIVYTGSYSDAQLENLRHHVLIKELFPYHDQGQIFRKKNQDICWTSAAEAMMELHRFSFIRGNEVHLRILKKYPGDIDCNINTFALHSTLYTVQGFSGGRSMDKELERANAYDIPLAVHIRRILGVLDILEGFHESGYLHLDISPDNILLIGEGRKERITLIDYNSVHTLQEIQSGQTVYYSEKEGYTAPEIRSGKVSDIGFASDLYAVTAVFYRCVTGKNLTVMQMVRGLVPDISDAECLKNMPETVVSMIRKILRKGLSSLACRRYKNAAQMRFALEELQDRINGKGITHWALWETGRAAVFHAVGTNPALTYIKEESKLYPIIGKRENGETVLHEKLLEEILSSNGASVLLLGSGGAGKTTALLRTAYLQKSKYSGMEPAVHYIPLYGWQEHHSSYIKDRLLESMKFKPETDSIETARHELLRLLSAPIHTKAGERPQLLLLLDGLNEASGNTERLIKEIESLAQLPGVRILLTSRSDEPIITFSRVYLCLLEEPEVRRMLAENGILPPENAGFVQALQVPIMLSLYIQTALDQKKQLFFHTKEELLDYYFSGLLQKELRNLPENSAELWQIDAALCYVLPEIAKLIHTKKTSVRDQDILPVIEKCFRRVQKIEVMKVFPGWIGHLSDIRGDARNGEEWYGQIVHEILWRRLGLLVRDEYGKYRISHQLIEEYLVEVERKFDKKFKKQGRIRSAVAIVLCGVMLFMTYQWISGTIKQPYDETLSENVLDAAFLAYIKAGTQYENISDLLECLQEEVVDEDSYERYLYRCKTDLLADLTAETDETLIYLKGLEQSLLEKGEVMPWSLQPLNTESYEALITLIPDRAKSYLEYIWILEQARSEEGLWEYFGADYLNQFQKLIEADAYVIGKYYNDVIAPELAGMKVSDSEKDQQNYHLFITDIALHADQDAITANATRELEIYLQQQKRAQDIFRTNGFIEYLKSSEGDDE